MNAYELIALHQDIINKTGNVDALLEEYKFIFRQWHGGKAEFDKAWQQALRIRDAYQVKITTFKSVGDIANKLIGGENG